MRTLEFTANLQQQDAQDPCQVTQQYVTEMLSEKLKDYGFQTESVAKTETLNVSVADYPIELGVSCRHKDDSEVLVCEITAHADESQDWFGKIASQSMIKQLANAVESSLNNDRGLSVLQWKK